MILSKNNTAHCTERHILHNMCIMVHDIDSLLNIDRLSDVVTIDKKCMRFPEVGPLQHMASRR